MSGTRKKRSYANLTTTAGSILEGSSAPPLRVSSSLQQDKSEFDRLAALLTPLEEPPSPILKDPYDDLAALLTPLEPPSPILSEDPYDDLAKLLIPLEPPPLPIPISFNTEQDDKLSVSSLTFFSPSAPAFTSVAESKQLSTKKKKKRGHDGIEYIGTYNERSEKLYYVILQEDKENRAVYVRKLAHGEEKYKHYRKVQGVFCTYIPAKKGLTVVLHDFRDESGLKVWAKRRNLQIIDAATKRKLFVPSSSGSIKEKDQRYVFPRPNK